MNRDALMQGAVQREKRRLVRSVIPGVNGERSGKGLHLLSYCVALVRKLDGKDLPGMIALHDAHPRLGPIRNLAKRPIGSVDGARGGGAIVQSESRALIFE